MNFIKLIFCILLFAVTMNAQPINGIVDKFERKSFTFDTTTINYRFYRPAVFNDSSRLPLILTLHGSGERGSDNEKQIALHGVATTWADSANQLKYPCYIVSPQ
jgi:predicted peptidase